jgi:hypothetical protein
MIFVSIYRKLDMGIFINGMPANTPEEKRKAIESQGGKYNELIQGHYIQGNGNSVVQGNGNQVYQTNIGVASGLHIGDNYYGDDFDDGNKTPGTGNYTENLQGEYISLSNKYVINYGGYELTWSQEGSQRYIGCIEVKDEAYELKAIFDRDEGHFLVYIPSFMSLFEGESFDSLNDVKLIEWAVVAIQENF